MRIAARLEVPGEVTVVAHSETPPPEGVVLRGHDLFVNGRHVGKARISRVMAEEYPLTGHQPGEGLTAVHSTELDARIDL